MRRALYCLLGLFVLTGVAALVASSWSLEIRGGVEHGPIFFARVAVAPRFEYRAIKALTLELPFYVQNDPENGGWAGGMMYRLKNGESSVAMFAGSELPPFGPE